MPVRATGTHGAGMVYLRTDRKRSECTCMHVMYMYCTCTYVCCLVNVNVASVPYRGCIYIQYTYVLDVAGHVYSSVLTLL